MKYERSYERVNSVNVVNDKGSERSEEQIITGENEFTNIVGLTGN